MSTQDLEAKSKDELYSLAKSQNLDGRSKMMKSELIEALTQKGGPKEVDFSSLERAITRRGEFDDVLKVEEGDTVEVSHLSQATPEVTQVTRSEDKVLVTMETSRGGRHRLIIPLGDQGNPQAKGAHLHRWRAGDQEWMMNSATPYYLRVLEDLE